MSEWNVINSSHLSENWRFDSEYWRQLYIQNLETIRAAQKKGFKTSLLRNLVKRVTGSAFYPSFVGYYSNDGIPFLRVADLGNLFLKQKNLVKIQSTIIKKHRQIATINPGDIVIAKGGSIGGACIVTDDLGESAVCRDVIAVQTDVERLDPYYLSIFLNTKFGKLQLERNKSQQVQAHLTFPAVERLEIAYPIPELQMEISEIGKLAYSAALKAKSFHNRAYKLFKSEFGLDKSNIPKPVGYTAPFSSVEYSRRLDPEHFYPAFHHLINNLNDAVSLGQLGTQLTFCQRGKQPIYSNHGLPVINSKHVQPNKIVLEGNRKAIPNPNPDLQIRHGDILINGTGRGTLGRAAPYLIDDPAIPDNHVTILRSPTLDPAYLSFYLNSQAGQLQVEMHQRGTSGQLELYPFDIRKFLVWAAPEEIQQEIRRLYDQAAESEKQSQELLETAKRRVEQLIEEAAAEE